MRQSWQFKSVSPAFRRLAGSILARDALDSQSVSNASGGLTTSSSLAKAASEIEYHLYMGRLERLSLKRA